MPEDMPEDMPDRIPNRMPEDMSDRMPEDLPVRKCINVMVGITRSKEIVVSISEPTLHQQLLACILSQYLHSSHPVPGPKKHVGVQKKEGAKVQKHPAPCERLTQ